MPDKNGIPSSHPYYYECSCGGCMVDKETYFRMINSPLLRCKSCNRGWHFFSSVAAEDEPRTNDEYGAKIDRYEDLVVHAQGEEERHSHD